MTFIISCGVLNFNSQNEGPEPEEEDLWEEDVYACSGQTENPILLRRRWLNSKWQYGYYDGAQLNTFSTPFNYPAQVGEFYLFDNTKMYITEDFVSGQTFTEPCISFCEVWCQDIQGHFFGGITTEDKTLSECNCKFF